MNATTASESPPRSRGRPRIAGADLTARQGPVLAAAGRLLTTRQSGDISVELLLQESGTSRPTFYRWFPGGLEQVFDQLIGKANAELVMRLMAAVSRCNTGEERITAGVRAYFDWGLEQGPVITGIYREGFTEGSVAQRYRQQTLNVAITLVNQHAEGMGLTALPPRLIETLVSWIETAGTVVFRHYPLNPAEVEAQCALTTRMCLATLRMAMEEHGLPAL
jgi:AcrR family transcriptional regulator